MYDDILVPTDGSAVIETTLEHGLRIASDHDATVHALYVVDNRIVRAAADGPQEEIKATLEREGTDAVEAVADRAADAGLDATTVCRRGIPDREIRAYADEADIDLIVIGTHGKSAREKLRTMGSVTERVVDDARVPVLVVREPTD